MKLIDCITGVLLIDSTGIYNGDVIRRTVNSNLNVRTWKWYNRLHFEITFVSYYTYLYRNSLHCTYNNCKFIQIYFIMWIIKFKSLKTSTAIFHISQSCTCWRYFFADCSKHERDFRRKYQRERSGREKYQRFQTRKTYSTAAEHSRDEARSNADLITGQTSRESRPGRDFISSVVGEMRQGGEEGGNRGRERES